MINKIIVWVGETFGADYELLAVVFLSACVSVSSSFLFMWLATKECAWRVIKASRLYDEND